MPGPAAVLLVDDARPERDAVAAGLAASGFVVRTARDGSDALRTLAEVPAHAVVLRHGTDLCRQIRDADAQVGIVVLGPRDSVDDRVAALASGADDCLTHPFALRELVARVEAITRRVVPSGPDTLTYADVRLDRAAHEAWRGDRPLALTDTERRLLARLLERPEVVIGRRELLLGVWGYDPGPTSNCLGVYVGYLRRKLEHDGEPRLLHTVRGTGYVLRTEELRKTRRSPLTDGAEQRLIGQSFCPPPRGAR